MLEGPSALLKRGWYLVVGAAVIGLLLAGLVVSLMPRQYQSTVIIYVASQGPDSTATGAYEGGLLSEQRVRSYTQLFTSDVVMTKVISKLGLDMSPAALAQDVTAEAEPDTILFTATVTQPSPDLAASVANASAEEFIALARGLEETPGSGRPGNVDPRLAQPATLNLSPVSPQVALNLFIGGLLGLIAGLLMAYLRVSGDKSVRSGDELEQVTSVSTVGEIPAASEDGSGPLALSNSPEAEEVRRLRVNLQFLNVDNDSRVFLITSAIAGEGKSRSTCNLAVSLAAAGERVVVVDCDLRRPQVAEYLGLEKSVGLTSVLASRVTVEQAIQYGPSGIAALTSGPIPPNPTELLGSQQMRSVVAELRQRFDYVLLDSPPVLPVADTLSAAPLADGVLIMCKWASTPGAESRSAADAIRGVGGRVVGGVLTMARPQRGRYSYSSYGRSDKVDPPAGDVVTHYAGRGDGLGDGATTQELDGLRARPSPSKRST